MVWIESITSTRGVSFFAFSTMRSTHVSARQRKMHPAAIPTGCERAAICAERFFAADVQRLHSRAERAERLQQQRRFADARIAADQHHRTIDQTAAEHAIELADADSRTRFGSASRRRSAQRSSPRFRPRNLHASAPATSPIRRRTRSACSTHRRPRTGPATSNIPRRIGCRRMRSLLWPSASSSTNITRLVMPQVRS